MKMFPQRHYRCHHRRCFGGPKLKLEGPLSQIIHKGKTLSLGVLGHLQGSEDLGDVAGYSSQVCSSGVVPILTPSMWWSCRVLRTSWFLGGWTPGLGAGSGTRQNVEGDQWGLLPLLFSHRFKPKCQIDEFYTMLCSSVDSEHLLLSHQMQHLKGLGTF